MYNVQCIFVQEVQFDSPDYFSTCYLPFFSTRGYKHVAKARTGDKQVILLTKILLMFLFLLLFITVFLIFLFLILFLLYVMALSAPNLWILC